MKYRGPTASVKKSMHEEEYRTAEGKRNDKGMKDTLLLYKKEGETRCSA